MKRYLFLKFGLTILVCAAAFPRTQVTETSVKNENRHRRKDEQLVNSNTNRQNTENNLESYQGVMGQPGIDFPVLTYIPRTNFTCRGKKSGYYADLETNCQVFHICDEGRKVSFLCPNGTIFQQSDLICDWWYKVDCASSPALYDESAEHLYEENLKRKESRRVQQQERRNQQREFHLKQQKHEEKSIQNKNNQQYNVVSKKDVNRFTSDQSHYRFNEKKSQHIQNNYKETQIPSETASFVSSKYNSISHYKSYNNLPTTVSYASSAKTFEETKPPSNRAGRTFPTTTIPTDQSFYRNQLFDFVKTTTQHTIYSPTVPPFTSAKYSTSPTTTGTTRKTGFYITKDFVPFSATVGYSSGNLFTSPEPIFTSPSGSETTTAPIYVVDSHPTSVTNRIETNVEEFTKFIQQQEAATTTSESEGTTTQDVVPSVPTPFKSQTEESPGTTEDDSSSTNKFNKFTYLPKSETNQPLTTPKPTNPTLYTTVVTLPTVNDYVNNMIKTLEQLDSSDQKTKSESDSDSDSRPGLNIPPSAGPKTLHSLAVYFATALDNLVSNDTSEEINEKPETTTEGTQVTLLSRTTLDKYNSLFNENNDQVNETEVVRNIDGTLNLRTLVEHDTKFNDLDLDGQQSRGIISSTPRIRQLAQVFTQALSAYLDDPNTFKRVLEEIRPTEPPFGENSIATTTTTEIPTTIEPRSYTKEQDEVLDFSDADKSSTYRPYSDNSISTTLPTVVDISSPAPFQKPIPAPTPNTLALDLNNGLKLSNVTITIDEISAPEGNSNEPDYFPFNTGESEEEQEEKKRKASLKPYGFGLKPTNSTPITDLPILNETWNDLTLSNLLLPPFLSSRSQELKQTESNSTSEEFLQSAHSQSFVPRGNVLSTEREGKSLNKNDPETTTIDYSWITTTTTQISTESTTTDISSTTTEISTTTDQTTTIPEETTTVPTTAARAVPENHWSTSPEVTKLWETTLYVNPEIINRNLGLSELVTTYRPDSTTPLFQTTTSNPTLMTTQPYQTTESVEESVTDLRYLSTTEEFPTSTIINSDINNLLNTSETELASIQARQIFGKLNNNEQDLLIEKMKEAESNTTVRRLILLLVSTCDASLANNKTVQETRNSILHALLGKDATLESTTLLETVTTSQTDGLFGQKSSTAILTRIGGATSTVNVKDVHQDTRALELLRSLYSLAAKWSQK